MPNYTVECKDLAFHILTNYRSDSEGDAMPEKEFMSAASMIGGNIGRSAAVFLFEKGMLRKDGGLIYVTDLGNQAARSDLDLPQTVSELREVIKEKDAVIDQLKLENRQLQVSLETARKRLREIDEGFHKVFEILQDL